MTETTTAARRVVSLWLPRFATDRGRRRQQRRTAGGKTDKGPRANPAFPPVFALAAPEGGTVRLAAVDAEAQRAGLFPGQTLADARALVPDLCVDDFDPTGDAAALAALADWCGRYTPWTAPSGLEFGGAAGIWLDVSGCAHLFGGEAAMLGDLTGRLERAGYTVRAGLADTAGAAWAAARFGNASKSNASILAPGAQMAVLAPWPLAALRLPPDTVEGLERLGLRTVAELACLPRAGLTRRFGELPARRLDQAAGRVDEPISPRAPVPVWRLRTSFPEALGRDEDIAAAARNLAEALCNRLGRAERGARRLELCLYRVGGRVDTVTAGTSRASRDPDHLMRLVAEQLDRLPEPPTSAPDALSAAAEAMVETLTLAATVTEPLDAAQVTLDNSHDADPAALERLVDRLAGRLGPEGVIRFTARDTHLPERVQAGRSALEYREDPMKPAPSGVWRAARPRPPRLLARPEPVEAVAPVPDDPPVIFRWRGRVHRVVRAEGPERIEPEWWRPPARPGRDTAIGDDTRDYYRVEDADGRRFWLYRAGLYDRAPAMQPRWYLHGLFG